MAEGEAETNYFKCKPGECVKCCVEAQVPLTLGDIYRAVAHERQVNGRRVGFSEAFLKNYSGQWEFIDTKYLPYSLPIPFSKKPCVHIDNENKRCSVYGKAQYVKCASYPQDFLMKVFPNGFENWNRSKEWEFFYSLPCSRSAGINPDNYNKILDLMSLASDEMFISGKSLNHPRQAVVAPRNARQVEEVRIELERRIMFFDGIEFAERLWENIEQTQERYMELMGITGIDYTVPLPKLLTDPIIRKSKKVGRNEPCPCGSGKKFKKCCGVR